MKKFWKIFGISLGSLVGVLIIVVVVAIWLVFTPERLTPIVQKESARFVNCERHIDYVELTFFSTFPNFGLKIHNVQLINPMQGAASDTLASIGGLTASIDLMEYLKHDRLILHYLTLDHGNVNLFINKEGKSNFDIFPNDTTQKEESQEFTTMLDINKVTLCHVKATYMDQTSGIDTRVGDLNGTLDFGYQTDKANGSVNLDMKQVYAAMADSVPLVATVGELALKVKGDMVNNKGNANVRLCADNAFVKLGNETYVNHQDINMVLPVLFALNENKYTIDKGSVKYGDLNVDLDGWAHLMGDSIDTNVKLKTNQWDVDYVLGLVPDEFRSMLDGMTVNGEAQVAAQIKGIYCQNEMPDILAEVVLKNGSFKSKDVPVIVKNIDTEIHAKLLLDSNQTSSATVDYLKATVGESKVKLAGNINDLMNQQLCNMDVETNLNFNDIKPFIPKELGMTLTGLCNGKAHAQFKLADLTDMNLNRIYADGNFVLKQLHYYTDSMDVKSPSMNVKFNLPSKQGIREFKELIHANIACEELQANMTGMGAAKLHAVQIDAVTNNPMDEKSPLAAIAKVKASNLKGNMDTIVANIDGIEAQVNYKPNAKNKAITDISLVYFNKNLKGNMGQQTQVSTGELSVVADVHYDEKKEETLGKWNPHLTVDLNQGKLVTPEITTNIAIPRINFDFTPGSCYINDSRFIVGHSDFSLHGELSNLDDYMAQKGLLIGQLDFESQSTDVNEIMALVNGMGRTDSVVPMESPEDNPFMVPKGVDIALNTKIKRAYAGNGIFDNVGGKLTVKDGVLVLEQMGFTSKAAEMQLTAMYRSDRKNHLFAGIDFHLLDIDIKELIHLIPDIDTILPMLKSFDGDAELHLAAETYLKSNYDLKMSTLRGAAAIEGKNLVVMDNETFSTIAKYMMFNKKTRNKIDTMSVEMTVFRNAVDVYPFLIVMDRYRAIISGQHNLDMSFDYNLSAIAPIRLGLEVKGDFDNMKYKLTKAENATLFDPKKQKVVEQQTMKLKNMISEELKANVKPRQTAQQ